MRRRQICKAPGKRAPHRRAQCRHRGARDPPNQGSSIAPSTLAGPRTKRTAQRTYTAQRVS
eukprot:73338-Lingulodinium_polyedra.AAC.1